MFSMRFSKLGMVTITLGMFAIWFANLIEAIRYAHTGSMWPGSGVGELLQMIESCGMVVACIGFFFGREITEHAKALLDNAEAESKPATEAVPCYVPPRKSAMQFAELPRTDPKSDSARHGHLSPLGDALQKIHERPEEVAHPPRTKTVGKLNGHGLGGERLEDNHEPGEYEAFTAHEPPQANDSHRTSDQAAHDRGAPQTASEHCFAGSDRKEHSFTERAQRERDENRFQAAEDEKAAWKREGAY